MSFLIPNYPMCFYSSYCLDSHNSCDRDDEEKEKLKSAGSSNSIISSPKVKTSKNGDAGKKDSEETKSLSRSDSTEVKDEVDGNKSRNNSNTPTFGDPNAEIITTKLESGQEIVKMGKIDALVERLMDPSIHGT